MLSKKVYKVHIARSYYYTIKPQKNQVKMNYSTIEFSRSGEIDKVTELNF